MTLICQGRQCIRPIRHRRPPRLYFVMQKKRGDYYVILAGRLAPKSYTFRRPIAAPHYELRACLRWSPERARAQLSLGSPFAIRAQIFADLCMDTGSSSKKWRWGMPLPGMLLRKNEMRHSGEKTSKGVQNCLET